MTLVITDKAAEAIRGIVDAHEFPDGSGVRIAAKPGGNLTGEPQLTVSAALDPAEGDTVIEEDGALVFLELGAAAYLGDKVLHAEVTDEERVRFVIHDA